MVPLFVENFYKNIWKAVEKKGKTKYWLYKQLAERGNEFAIAKVQEYEKLKFFTYNSPKPPGIK